MPNGTLKYKQDDGSIVELTPVGVDTEARALATNEATRAKAAEQKLENDKADKSAIPDVSALVTKEIYDAGQAAQDAKITALKAVAPDILPYSFGRINVSSLFYSPVSRSSVSAYVSLPWLHSRMHLLTARLVDSVTFYVVNLNDGYAVKVTDNITIVVDNGDASPYHVNVEFQIPVNVSASTPYLIATTNAYLTIE